MKHSKAPKILIYDSLKHGPERWHIYIRRDVGFGGWVRYTTGQDLNSDIKFAEIFSAFNAPGPRVYLNTFRMGFLKKLYALFDSINGGGQ